MSNLKEMINQAQDALKRVDTSQIEQAHKIARTAIEKMNQHNAIGKISNISYEFPKISIPVDPNLASEFHKRLAKLIIDFENGLDKDHEIGAKLVSFGETVRFHIEDIGYYNPSLIIFNGQLDNGDPVSLIQHISQISVLLISMKNLNPEKPRRIGFRLQKELEKKAEEQGVNEEY